MAKIEDFTDQDPAHLSTVYFYARDTASAAPKDRRFKFPALMQGLFNTITTAQARAVLGFITNTVALNFPSIAAGAQADLTIAVGGAAVGDAVILGLPSPPAAGLVFNAFVSSPGTVTIRASNISSGAVDESNLAFRAIIVQS